MQGRVKLAGGNGFAWFPDTAAWVTPTCFGILALQKAAQLTESPEILARYKSAREFLLTHACQDGGWNYGSADPLGYEAVSYPETTGQVLLALHDATGDRLSRAVDRADKDLRQCRSLEAMSWLKLGLVAQGVKLPLCRRPRGNGSVPEVSLAIIADTAAGGRNVFLE